MKRTNLFENYSGSKKNSKKKSRIWSYILVSAFTVILYFISNKTGYYIRRNEGIVKEHDPVNWLSALQGTLSDLPIVLFTLVLIFGITEFRIHQKQENTT